MTVVLVHQYLANAGLQERGPYLLYVWPSKRVYGQQLQEEYVRVPGLRGLGIGGLTKRSVNGDRA
jgi:hypothetical protein